MNQITIDNVTITEDQLKALILQHPELVKQEKKSHFFKPKRGDVYIWLGAGGHIDSNIWANDKIDCQRLALGNVYHTEDEAQKEVESRKALVRLWDWAEENEYFEPDWRDHDQFKYYVFYRTTVSTFHCGNEVFLHSNFTLPYFATQEACERFIKACEKDLLAYWKIK